MFPTTPQPNWHTPGDNVPGNYQPPPPRRRWHLRWAWLSIPLACLLAAGVLHIVRTPTFAWGDVLDGLHISANGRGRYTQLAVLGLTLIGVVAVLRVLRKKGA